MLLRKFIIKEYIIFLSLEKKYFLSLINFYYTRFLNMLNKRCVLYCKCIRTIVYFLYLKFCSFSVFKHQMHVCILVAFYYARECHSQRTFKNNLSDRATRSTEENHLLFLPRPSLFLFIPSSLFLSVCLSFSSFLPRSSFLYAYTEAYIKEGKESPA